MIAPHPALVPRPASLCQLAGNWRGTVSEGGTWAEPKLDGVRALWCHGELITREGVPIHGTAHIAAALGALEVLAGRALVFDGEFIVDDDYRATLAHIGRRAAAPPGGALHLFDMIEADAWARDDDETPLYRRNAGLVALVRAWEAAEQAKRAVWDWEGHTRRLAHLQGAIAVVQGQWLDDAAAVRDAAHAIWARGGEGLMLKDWSAPYRRNRTQAWQKVKREGWAVRPLRRTTNIGMERTGR